MKGGCTITVHRGRRVIVSHRICQLRRRIRTDTQQMRLRTIRQLEQLFFMASSFARGEQRWQRINGNIEPIGMKQRQLWARIAAYIAQTMTSVTEKFDERQIDKDLDELERLVDEANKTCKMQKADQGKTENPELSHPADGQGSILRKSPEA
jgi:hypothetical protein